MPLLKVKDMQVLVRVDYNLSNYDNLERIKVTLETIKELLENNNRVILLSHKGRPNGEEQKYSLAETAQYVEQELNKIGINEHVEFVNQYEGFEKARKIIRGSDSKIFLLENTRFAEDEKSKDKEAKRELAENYAMLGNYFVDEAFAVSHRKEATNYEIKEFLLNCLGESHKQEIENLTRIKENPQPPYIFIMGGAKLETKLGLVKKVLPKADKVFLAGLLAFTFIKAGQELGKYQDLQIFNSYIETEFLEEAKKLIGKYEDKIVLPVDFVYDEEDGMGKYCADVGEKTLAMYKEHLKDAKTVFWNGPLGRYEKKPFDQRTKELAEYIANLDGCFSVLGGGDIVSAVPESMADKFGFVSMGGGASLSLLGR